VSFSKLGTFFFTSALYIHVTYKLVVTTAYKLNYLLNELGEMQKYIYNTISK